jgi:hypothetical protein
MEFEEGCGALEGALMLEAALGLDFAEGVEGALELAGEALAVDAERGELGNEGLGVGALGEDLGLEQWDAVETPGGVGEFLR